MFLKAIGCLALMILAAWMIGIFMGKRRGPRDR